MSDLQRTRAPAMSEGVQGTGLRVLISGAGTGVGFACASAFARSGAELILCDTDGIALAGATEALGSFSRFCDVVSETSVAIFAQELLETFPSIDILINAAGRGYVRSLGMMRLTHAVSPMLRKAHGQRLIFNVAPVAGFVRTESLVTHAGSVEGFQRLSNALAQQFKGSSIRVLSVAPRLLSNRTESEARVSADKLYQRQRIDEEELAQRIHATVARERPHWRPAACFRNRRA